MARRHSAKLSVEGYTTILCGNLFWERLVFPFNAARKNRWEGSVSTRIRLRQNLVAQCPAGERHQQNTARSTSRYYFVRSRSYLWATPQDVKRSAKSRVKFARVSFAIFYLNYLKIQQYVEIRFYIVLAIDIAIHRKFQTRHVAEGSVHSYGEVTQHRVKLFGE